jgi:hypothetical protein
MEEPEDLDLQKESATMKMTKRRWEHRALPVGFALHPVPKGFKLPHDQQKYDGSQEPQSWLSDYLQAVQILGGTKETAMQSL